MNPCKNSGNRKHVRDEKTVQDKHEVSDGTFSDSNTPFEGYVIAVHAHHFSLSDTPKFATPFFIHVYTNMWEAMGPSQI